MRVRRGETFTLEEYATDLSSLRDLILRGTGEILEPMRPVITEPQVQSAGEKLRKAAAMVDQVILPASATPSDGGMNYVISSCRGRAYRSQRAGAQPRGPPGGRPCTAA